MTTIYDFNTNTLSGKPADLSAYKGKVVLIVNTASQCGLTPQYEGLQKLYDDYKDEGFVVLGFPCNQFGGQEPGSSEEVQQFCSLNYGVSFPLFEKTDVRGPEAHPLFQYLIQAAPSQENDDKDIKWNFTKFLVDREGRVVARFEPPVLPSEFEGAVKELL